MLVKVAPEPSTAKDLRSSSDLGHIKGASFREFVAWWERDRGTEEIQEAMGKVSESLAKRFLNPERQAMGLLPSAWYPAELPHQILDALLENIPKPQHRKIAEAGADAVMSTTLKGVYRAVFSLLASPRRYPKYVQRIWDMHYDSGKVIMTEPEPNQHLNRFIDWRAHHPFICALNMASGLPIYRAMGVQTVEYEFISCISQGAEECQSLVRWT